MKTKLIGGILFAVGSLAFAACGEETSIEEFDVYGEGMPGTGLVEGGEALLERIFISPGLAGGTALAVNQFHAYQYGGAFMGATRAPDGTAGGCFEFIHPNSFPIHDIGEGAEYVDWGESVTLSGPGLGGGVDVPQIIAGPEGLVDNRASPVRNHKEGNWLYGGPTWQGANFQEFDLEPGGEYALDIGIDRELTFDLAPEYDFPLNSGTEDVEIQRDAALDLTWEVVPQAEGTTQTRAHHFTFIAFAEFPQEGDRGPTPTWFCTPSLQEDGGVTVPAEIISTLPDAGIFQAGRLTHFMEALEDNDGELRRFDLFTVWCSVSLYNLVD